MSCSRRAQAHADITHGTGEGGESIYGELSSRCTAALLPLASTRRARVQPVGYRMLRGAR